jgi:hypothetical protein
MSAEDETLPDFDDVDATPDEGEAATEVKPADVFLGFNRSANRRKSQCSTSAH